jgi:hypothetical protein
MLQLGWRIVAQLLDNTKQLVSVDVLLSSSFLLLFAAFTLFHGFVSCL